MINIHAFQMVHIGYGYYLTKADEIILKAKSPRADSQARHLASVLIKKEDIIQGSIKNLDQTVVECIVGKGLSEMFKIWVQKETFSKGSQRAI